MTFESSRMSDPSLQVRETIEALLSELRDEGALDSSGRFTLDPSRAQQKFRQFLTRDYSCYALWLAAAGVAVGATRLKVTRGLEHICAEFEGWHSPPQEFPQLLDDSATLRSDHIGHLSFALNALLSASPSEILLESNDQRLKITPGEVRIDPLRQPQPGRFRLVAALCQPDFEHGDIPEKAMLLRRIPRQVLAVEINCTPNTPLVLWDEFHGSHYWPGNTDLLPLIQPVPRRIHTHEAAFSALVEVDSWQRGQQAEVLFLHQGILFPMEVSAPLPYRALVCWPELKLDLGRSSIVMDAPLQSLLEQLHGRAELAAEDFLHHYADLAPDARDRAGGWLEYLMHRFQTQGRKADAELCQDWLQAHHSQTVRWFTSKDSRQLLRQSLDVGVPSMPTSLPAPPRAPSFWQWLSQKWSPSSPSSVPRAPGGDKKRWKQLLAGLLEVFEPESGLRLGLSGPTGEPDRLQLEGVLVDGCSLLVTAWGRQLELRLHSPSYWDISSLPLGFEAPPGWTVSLDAGSPWKASLNSRAHDWRDPEQLASILAGLAQARRAAQSGEQLRCPGCSLAMEKWLLDVVLDRCASCQGLWLDHRELEWLLEQNPGMSWDLPVSSGPCPRCGSDLKRDTRAQRATLECPRCQGSWLRPHFLGPGKRFRTFRSG